MKREGEKMNKLLQMENLERHYETPAGVVKALDGVSFEIHEGERVILLVLLALERPLSSIVFQLSTVQPEATTPSCPVKPKGWMQFLVTVPRK